MLKLKYRALAVKLSDEWVWFWIGDHNVYDIVNTGWKGPQIALAALTILIA